MANRRYRSFATRPAYRDRTLSLILRPQSIQSFGESKVLRLNRPSSCCTAWRANSVAILRPPTPFASCVYPALRTEN